MKLKTKLFAPLFVILFMGMATSAFADMTCAITVTNLAARETVNSHWANTGDLLFTCSAPNATATTDASITVAYGLTITNRQNVPGGGNHVITVLSASQTGSFATPATAARLDTTRTDTGTTGISNTGGLVAILVPAQAAPAGGTFTLQNVLLSLAGGTTAGQVDLKANVNVLSASGNFVLTNTTPVIISAVTQSLSNVGSTAPALTQGPGQFQANGATLGATAGCTSQACIDARSRFTVTVSENYIDAWRIPATYYNNGVGTTINGTDVVYTFSGMQPGSTITNCVLQPPTGTTWQLSGSGIANAAGVASFVAEILNAGGAPNNTLVETLTLLCGTSQSTPAYNAGISTAPATTNITVTMHQGPTGTALPDMGGPGVQGGTPRYQAGTTVGPLTVIVFSGTSTGQTTMIVPWATGSGAAAPPAGTFNTGIVVANTTKDPAGFGVNGASDSSGSITFYFFPADGSTSFGVTPTTGFNLSGGVVPSGGSFIGLVSDILKAGSQTSTFTGYIIMVANFSHAHPSAFVFGGAGAADRITSAQDVLVINNPAFRARDVFDPILNFEATGR